MKVLKVSVLTAVLAGTLFVGMASATPSTQIWIPSTDIQPYKKVHLGFDQYIKQRRIDGTTREANVINNGITVGVLPYEKIQMELGIDLRYYALEPYDSSPVYFNAKIATPEDALFKGSPAIAVGGYDFGTSSVNTDYNILYGLVAKTIGKLGRFSAGYFQGNDKLLRDANGQADETGVLLSWDRTLSEISDKLWVAIDYQGGKSSYGALSYGAAWKFAPNVGVIFGFDDWNNDNLKPTYTFQVDIDF